MEKFVLICLLPQGWVSRAATPLFLVSSSWLRLSWHAFCLTDVVSERTPDAHRRTASPLALCPAPLTASFFRVDHEVLCTERYMLEITAVLREVPK